MKRDNINYEALERAGECSISTLSTGSIDYNEVLEFIQKLVKDNNFNVLAICYDIYNSDFLTPKLELIAPIVQIKQRNLEMSEGIKTFKEEVRNGKVKLSNKNLLKIANHNLVITENDSGLVYMKKNRYGNKIDPMFATMDAFVFINNERLLDPDRVVFDDAYYSNYSF
jgi:phage terminase large subunit-like protein